MGPALPVLLLAASLLQQDGYFPDKRGEWGQRVDVAARADYAVPAAQARAFGERLGTLAGVLRGAAVFNPPLGIQPRFTARWWVPEECSAGLATCRNRPVQGQVGVILYYFVADRNGQPSWGGEANTSADIWINAPLATFVSAGSYDVMGAPYLPLPDGRHISFMPRKTGALGGFPLYDDKLLVVTRGARPWWVPVTRQQYLEAMIRHAQGELGDVEKRLATVRDPYADWVSKTDERRRTREQTYQKLKTINAAQAEQYLATAVKMEADVGAGLKAAAPSTAIVGDPVKVHRDIVAALRAELAALAPGERAAQAWLAPLPGTPGDIYRSGLAPAGAEGARALVASNPDFFDRSLPRTDWQLLTVHFSDSVAPSSATFIGTVRLRDFATTADWRAVSALLR